MTFAVTYRGADGALREESVEAADRAACVATCRARGIVPVRIVAGHSSATKARLHQDGGSPNRRGLPLIGKAAILTVAVFAVAGGAWWWFGRNEVRPSQVEKPKREHPVAKHKPKTPAQKPVPVPVAEDETNHVAEVAPSLPPPQRKHREIASQERLPDGSIIRTWSDGRKSLLINPKDPEKEKNRPPPRYKHPVDEVLAMFTEPGASDIPAPSRYNDAKVRAALDEPIDIDMNTDDEDVIAEKQAVQQMRDELRMFLDAGGTTAEYVQKLQERQASEAYAVRESRTMILQAFRDGKYDEAKALIGALNKHLAEKSIPPLRFGKKFNQILEERTKLK